MDANQTNEVKPTASQLSFHWAIASAARILLDDLQVEEEESTTHRSKFFWCYSISTSNFSLALGHCKLNFRIYRLEVVELHPEVSFILLVPSHSEVCSAPGQQVITGDEKRGCLTLPVPIFELAHLCTYQPEFISLYCRLSSLVDVNLLAAQHLFRQVRNIEHTVGS